MNHDPEDEVTVISAEGIEKGVLRGNTIHLVGTRGAAYMGYERGGSEIGLVEKAAKIAIKHGVIYDPKAQAFKGDKDAAARAHDELESGQAKQSLNQRAAERSAW